MSSAECVTVVQYSPYRIACIRFVLSVQSILLEMR